MLHFFVNKISADTVLKNVMVPKDVIPQPPCNSGWWNLDVAWFPIRSLSSLHVEVGCKVIGTGDIYGIQLV